MQGKFIVFEGPDGAGKTTAAKLLADYLIGQGRQVVLTKEPTSDSEAGRKIRGILLEEVVASPKELQRLFAEDRREHVRNIIIPALNEGKTVISDRYFFSSLAFGSLDLDLEWLIELNKDFPIPDATFILLSSPEVCIERAQKRGAKITLFEKLEKLKRVNEVYKKLPERFKNVYIIDSEKPISEVHQEVIAKLKEIHIIN